jgi:hypothetical protein
MGAVSMAEEVKLTLRNPNAHQMGQIQQAGDPFSINFTCPHCSRLGTFGGVGVKDVRYTKSANATNAATGAALGTPDVAYGLGIRQCANLERRGLVAVVYHSAGSRLVIDWIAPPELIDFRATQIPSKVAESMKEAIACHAAGAFPAAAIMVRRTLERLCQDRGGARQARTSQSESARCRSTSLSHPPC